MSKLSLNTVDKVKAFEFDRAHIYTDTYNAPLNKNQIHTPNAAKIIIEGNGIISSFIVIQPLINVKDDGSISIHTPSTERQATLKEKYKQNKEDIKTIKRDLKILTAKFELGLSIEELIDMGLSTAKLEAMKLEDRTEKIDEGGGF